MFLVMITLGFERLQVSLDHAGKAGTVLPHFNAYE